MATILVQEGRRVYLAGLPFGAKDRAKAELGAKWDADRRQWWVGTAKRAAAEALVAGLDGPTPESRAAAEGAGLDPDTPPGIVADYLKEHGRDAEARAVERPRADPRSIRLTGKGEYQGRTYYLGASTRDGARVRLLTLPDAGGAFLDFWAPAAEVKVTKRYEARERWNGAYGRHSRQVVQHQTLGGIADFLRRQGNPATRTGECSECGAWGPSGSPCRECGGEGTHG